MEEKREKVKLEKGDLIAIMVAQFQILFPIVIGGAVIMALLMVFLLKIFSRG